MDDRPSSDVTQASRSGPAGRPTGDGARAGSRHEVVVVGAGIGGLTAGALLARAGKKVLVVEQEAQPGGCAQALRRGPYTFDKADHLIMGCAPESPFGPGLVDAVLRRLGVRDRCELVRVDDPIYTARFPDLALSIPHGREGYLAAHLRHFPGEARGLTGLVELAAGILRELIAFPLDPGPVDLLLTPARFPRLFRYRNATVKDVVDRALGDPRLRAAVETLWSWIGPPPGRGSFVAWAAMMASYVEDGAYYCRGSYQRLADALAEALASAGGELLTGTRVAGILAERSRVRGVVLEDGRRIEAPVVLSNVDARETFERLLGPDQVPARFLRRLRRMEVGDSIVALYAATDLDAGALGARHDTQVFTDWDHDRAHAAALAGRVSFASVLIPTLKDPSLAPAGQHLVILKTVAPPPHGGTPRDDGALASGMLALAERVLPDLRRHLTFVDQGPAGAGASPRLRELGPYSGWAASPRQFGIRRLPRETPVAGLTLVGQWTRPGHGIWPVVASGVAAARVVLGAPTAAPVLPLGV